MDEQSKQAKKKKWFKVYLNIYYTFIFFSSYFCVVSFLSKLDFLSNTLYTILCYVFFAVHIYSFQLILIHGEEELLVDESEKNKKYF